MTWQDFEERWSELAIPARLHWDRLTPADCAVIAGDHDRLVRRVQVLYFLTSGEAARQVAEFAQTVRLDGQRRGSLGKPNSHASGAVAPAMSGTHPHGSAVDPTAAPRAPSDRPLASMRASKSDGAAPKGMDFGIPERMGPASAPGPPAPGSE